LISVVQSKKMSELQQRRRTEVKRSSDWYDAALVEEKPSRLSGVVFVSICAVAILAVAAFGAVDVASLGLFSVLVAAIGALWIVDAVLSGQFRFSTNPLQLPLIGLILIGAIQLLPLRSGSVADGLLALPQNEIVHTLSIAPYLTRFAIVQLVAYLVFFAAALVFVNNQKRLRLVVTTLVSFGALWAFFGILQRLANLDGIYGVRASQQAMIFASYVNQHHFAALMEMTVGLTLALLFGGATKPDKRIFLVVAAVVMGIALLFTGSRGGLLSLLAVLSFLFAANFLKRSEGLEGRADNGERSKNYRRKFAFIIGGLAVLIGVFGASIMLGGDESLLRIVGLAGNETDVSNGRSHFWATALKIIADYPIMGAGLDTFGIAFPRYDTWNGEMRVEQAHNDYLQILADAGILGLACVLAFVFLLFKQGLRTAAKSSDAFRRSAAVGALAGCFGIVIHSLFDFPLRTPGNAYFFLILATLATTTINYPKLYKKTK
jgi:O-antigen ligase